MWERLNFESVKVKMACCLDVNNWSNSSVSIDPEFDFKFGVIPKSRILSARYFVLPSNPSFTSNRNSSHESRISPDFSEILFPICQSVEDKHASCVLLSMTPPWEEIAGSIFS